MLCIIPLIFRLVKSFLKIFLIFIFYYQEIKFHFPIKGENGILLVIKPFYTICSKFRIDANISHNMYGINK